MSEGTLRAPAPRGREPQRAAVDPWRTPPHLARTEATYTVLAATFAVVLVLTNVVGTKLFLLFPDGGPSWFNGGRPVTLTAGIVTYPLTFLLTDLVSEIWGRRRANLMVILGFAMSLLMLGVLQLGVWLPPSPLWSQAAFGFDSAERMQEAYQVVFHNPRLLLFASMLAYLVAQLFDVRLYHFWWKVTKGRWMFVRNNGSTAISQLVDTIIVNGIFLRWGFGLEWGTIGEIILWVYVCKLVLALCDTPFIYLGRTLLLRFFGLERDAAPRHAPLQ